MPQFCAVFGCSNRSNREKDKRYFRVPKVIVHKGEKWKKLTEERRKKWISNLHLRTRGAEGAYARVCGEHFVKGSPSALVDTESVDWAPTVKLGYQNSGPKSVSSVRRDQRMKQKEGHHKQLECSEAISVLQQIPQGQCMLRKGAVPVLFDWNDYSLPPPRPGVGNLCSDHDYCFTNYEPAAVDVALSEAAESQAQAQDLQRKTEYMSLRCRFGLQRFAGSDEDIRLNTRFSSYAHLMSFWSLIEPALPHMVRVTSSQTETSGQNVRHLFPTSLSPIDEFFIFMNYLSLDLTPKDLAYRFLIHLSTVSRIITNWTNLLYQVLGAIGIWLDEEAVRSHMPEVFSEYSDTQVILDCTELRCQSPDSPWLQREPCSSYKPPHCTFKGLIGMAPHGAITFISPLYEGSVSHRDILEHSGLVPLLKPSMAVMVDMGFCVEDLVPCKVHTPAFLKEQSQSSARLSAHVERVMRKVKEHKLFSKVRPMSPSCDINQLYVVTCLLLNYQNGP